MKLLFGHTEDVVAWVGWRIPLTALRLSRNPTESPFGAAQAIGVINDSGKLVAGVVYHSYDPDCRVVEVSCAAESRAWAKPEIVRSLLRYPFSDLRCQRITAVTPRRATSARRFLEGLGFKREGSARRGFGSDNAILYGLLIEDWEAHRLNQPPPGGPLDGEEGRQRSAPA